MTLSAKRARHAAIASSIAVHSLDQPRARRRTGRAAADHRRAVQQPDHDLSGRRVVPGDVAEPVAVEVAGAGDRPWARRGTRRAAADHAGAIEQPHQQLAGCAVAPEDVVEAVAVEVALSDDRPRARRRTERAAADHAGPVDQPGQHLPAARVVPENVAHAVAVEIVSIEDRCGVDPCRPDKAVVSQPADDGGVARHRNGGALPCGSYRVGAGELVLLTPYADAAVEHPRRAVIAAFELPATTGGVL